MILHRSRLVPAAMVALGAAVLWALGAAFLAHVARADGIPPPLPAASPGFDWEVWLALALGAVGGLKVVLEGIAMVLRPIAPLTKTTIDDRVLAVDEAMHDKLDELLRLFGGLLPAKATPAPPAIAPARDSQAGWAAWPTMLAVLALGVAGIGAVQVSCSWRQHAAAGAVAFLDCEAANLPPDTLADATALGIGAIGNAISGSGHVDASRIKADMSSLKTDLGRCAFAAAVAALVTPVPPQPGAPAAAELVVDVTALKGAFTRASAELGWPEVRVAGKAP